MNANMLLLGAALFFSSHTIGQTVNLQVSTADKYRYYFVLNNSDDEIIVTINDSRVYNFKTDHDPNLNNRVEITGNLQKSTLTTYVNKIIVDGWNGETGYHDFPVWNPKLKHNPWHFKYRIERVDVKTGTVETIVSQDVSGPAPNAGGPGYKAATWTHDIVKE